MPEGARPTNTERFRAIILRVLSRGQEHDSLVIDIACTIGAEILDGSLSPGCDLNSVDLGRSLRHQPYAGAGGARDAGEGRPGGDPAAPSPPRRRSWPRRDPRDLPRSRRDARPLRQRGLRARKRRRTRRSPRDRHADAGRGYGRRPRRLLLGHVRFHERFAELARNRTLLRQLDSLVLRSLRFRRRTLSNPERVSRSIADHLRLVVALEDRDPVLASALASANVLGALRMLETMLDTEEAAAATSPDRAVSRG